MSSTPCPHISGLCDFLSPGINLPRPLTAFEQHHLKNYNATTFGPVSVIGNKRAIFEGMFKTSSFGSKDLRKSFSSSHRVKAPSALPSSIADGSDPLAHLMRLEHQIKVREHKRLKRHNFDDREAARYCARTHVKSVLHEEHLDNYKRSLTCKKVEQELCEACEKPLALEITRGFRCLQCLSSFCRSCLKSHASAAGDGEEDRRHSCFAAVDPPAALYCALCDDYVHHKKFQEAAKVTSTGRKALLDLGYTSHHSPPLTPFQASVRLLLRSYYDSLPSPAPTLLRIPKPVGLYNIGNTCYMNCTLQCLMATETIQTYFLESAGHDSHTCKRRKSKSGVGCLACALDGLFLSTYSSSIGVNVSALLSPPSPPDPPPQPRLLCGFPIVPDAVLTTGWTIPSMRLLRGYGQHDAHEYLQALLHALEKDVKCAPASQTNIVEAAFGGRFSSALRCKECGTEREQEETFINVSVEVTGGEGQEQTTLAECLAKFTEPEPLSTMLRCETCSCNQVFSKQLKLKPRFPPHLVLHLKRFDAAKNKKISRPVLFPSSLDMSPYSVPAPPGEGEDETMNYSLYAVVNHEGGLHQGHYTSHVKRDGKWYRCQDEKVYVVDEKAVLAESSTAYVLFYSKQQQ